MSRKRRLSDADTQGAPKRPRNLPVGPRLHAVSDPLPMSSALVEASSFDDWFKVNFDLPSLTATEDELVPSGCLEVELFDCSTLHPGASLEFVKQNTIKKRKHMVCSLLNSLLTCFLKAVTPVLQNVVLSEAIDLTLPSVETNQHDDVGLVSFVSTDEFDLSGLGEVDLFKWPPVDGKEDEPPATNVTGK